MASLDTAVCAIGERSGQAGDRNVKFLFIWVASTSVK